MLAFVVEKVDAAMYGRNEVELASPETDMLARAVSSASLQYFL